MENEELQNLSQKKKLPIVFRLLAFAVILQIVIILVQLIFTPCSPEPVNPLVAIPDNSNDEHLACVVHPRLLISKGEVDVKGFLVNVIFWWFIFSLGQLLFLTKRISENDLRYSKRSILISSFLILFAIIFIFFGIVIVFGDFHVVNLYHTCGFNLMFGTIESVPPPELLERITEVSEEQVKGTMVGEFQGGLCLGKKISGKIYDFGFNGTYLRTFTCYGVLVTKEICDADI